MSNVKNDAVEVLSNPYAGEAEQRAATLDLIYNYITKEEIAGISIFGLNVISMGISKKFEYIDYDPKRLGIEWENILKDDPRFTFNGIGKRLTVTRGI